MNSFIRGGRERERNNKEFGKMIFLLFVRLKDEHFELKFFEPKAIII